MDSLQTIRPEMLVFSSAQMEALLPYAIVFGGTLLAIIASVMRLIPAKWPVYAITLAAMTWGVFASLKLVAHEPVELFNGMMVSDQFSNFFNAIFLFSALFTVLSSFRYLDKEQLQYPEFYVLILFSAIGMMLMGSSTHLLMVFIALELMSLSVYVLVGFRRADRLSNEASMKYFIMGGAASAVLLYGAALIYGVTGTMQFSSILEYAVTQGGAGSLPTLFTLGAWLVVAGFLFKIASVPFHMWLPDVYEGAPVPITGFMTTGIKAAAFATFLRVFVSLGYGDQSQFPFEADVHDVLWVIAALTMVVGNVIALTQTNLKRLLGYSSIAHTGYIMLGLLSGSSNPQGYSAAVTYLVVYTIMNLGAFAVLSSISFKGDSGLNLHDLSGLGKRHPWLAFTLAVFLLSMAGIPPTAGFIAKYVVFYSAVQSGEIWLVMVGVLTSAISVYYYLRVLVFMYMREPTHSPEIAAVPAGSVFAISLMVMLILEIGVMPSRLIEATQRIMLHF